MVRGVGCCNDETIAALVQHGDPVGLADFGVQRILGQAQRVQRVHVDQGRAEHGRDRVRQIGGRDGARADQLGDERSARGLRLPDQVFCSLLVELASGHQGSRQSWQNNGSHAFGGDINSGHVCN
ncbi:hypothetical protein SDC9_177029 [bioreactor metagenome]|uniref:Uncharacterized protein n=1 Tax=bioreactor metagenome TaxID=1076179 RepID=A0A645GTN5_9ZZZZ